jgi:hypothetical protein
MNRILGIMILVAIVAVEIIGVLEWTSPRDREDAYIGAAARDDKS